MDHLLFFRVGRKANGTNAPLIIKDGEHMLLHDKLCHGHHMLTHDNTRLWMIPVVNWGFCHDSPKTPHSLPWNVRAQMFRPFLNNNGLPDLCSWQPFTGTLHVPDGNELTHKLKSGGSDFLAAEALQVEIWWNWQALLRMRKCKWGRRQQLSGTLVCHFFFQGCCKCLWHWMSYPRASLPFESIHILLVIVEIWFAMNYSVHCVVQFDFVVLILVPFL